MKHIYDTFTTPIGSFTVALDENGTLVATAFGDLAKLKEFSSDTQPLQPVRDAALAREAREQVLEYFARKRKKFTLKLAPNGTAFQKNVWAALSRIPYGVTRSYAEIAVEIGNAKASRAVGGANGSNPIPLIVPCHRVIGADGSLTGFAYGNALKQRLLEHEGALLAV